MGKADFSVDISSLLQAVGIQRHVVVRMNEHAYEFDAQDPKNNWLYPALLGFQELQRRLKVEHATVNTFVTIGTGAGIDAIGAVEIFHPKKVVLSDIHPEVLPIAEKNFSEYVYTTHQDQIDLSVFQGHLLEPLIAQGMTADVIYANLPNIPFLDMLDPLLSQQLTSSFHTPELSDVVPVAISRYLLAMQYAVLKQAGQCLVGGGSILINLGGRVPIGLVKKMFQDNGYEYEELVNVLKVQTQPELMLSSYAKFEQANQVEFDFYRQDQALSILNNNSYSQPLSASAMKELLLPARVNATTGLHLFSQDNESISHIVQLIRGIK